MGTLEAIRSIRAGFVPRTQAQAFQALKRGLVDEAVCVWRSVNVRPILEEPWDLDEIERLLAKEDLDESTVLALVRIFDALSRGSDKEAALFAAESLNALELRHERRVQRLRKTRRSDPSPRATLALAQAYRALSLACRSRPVLARFYLGEALSTLDEGKSGAMPERDRRSIAVAASAILVELGDPEGALERLASPLARKPSDPALRLAEARARFAARDFVGVARALEAAESERDDPDAGLLDALRECWRRVGH
ncbi:MAG: hypothetical protein JXA15_01200 [Spirochaetales bacterium]|nr:hypothetical protein [Spirochaetales bacterium]